MRRVSHPYPNHDRYRDDWEDDYNFENRVTTPLSLLIADYSPQGETKSIKTE